MNGKTIAKSTARNLPFGKLATEGPGALFRNFFPFLQMATIAISLFMLCWLVIVYFGPRDFAPFLIIVSDRVMTTFFGMAWLGYLLMPEEHRRYWVPRWSRQHSIFLFYSLCISGVTLLQGGVLRLLRERAASVFWSYDTLLTAAVNLPADLIHAAIGLTFCALAVKQRGGPIWSLRLIGWSALKIVVIATFISFCFTMAGGFLSSVLRAIGEPVDFFGLLSALPRNLANYAAYAVVLGLLASAYQHLTDWHGVRRDVVERFD